MAVFGPAVSQPPPQGRRPIKVCVVDNEDLTAAKVSEILKNGLEPETYVVAEPLGSVLQVDSSTDVVVCDLHLPPHEGDPSGKTHLSGPAAVRYLVKEVEVQVVAMSGRVPPAVVTAALAAGARSYLTEDGHHRPTEWVKAVATAADCRYYLTAALASDLLKDAEARPLEDNDDLNHDARSLLKDWLIAADEASLFRLIGMDRRWRMSSNKFGASLVVETLATASS